VFPFRRTKAKTDSFWPGPSLSLRSVWPVHYTVNGTMLRTQQGCIESVITCVERPRGPRMLQTEALRRMARKEFKQYFIVTITMLNRGAAWPARSARRPSQRVLGTRLSPGEENSARACNNLWRTRTRAALARRSTCCGLRDGRLPQWTRNPLAPRSRGWRQDSSSRAVRRQAAASPRDGRRPNRERPD